jgi:phospholipase A1
MMMRKFNVLIFLPAFFVLPALAEAENCTDMDSCLTESMRSASEDMTIGELKARCKACVEKQQGTVAPEVEQSPLDARREEEKETGQDWFVLTPHRANYVLPVAYNNSPNIDVYGGAVSEDDIDNTEVKFQLSIKYQLFDNIYKDNWDLYIAYTNLSYWQAYNSNYSSPFRDTNHEPEAWVQYDTDWDLFWGIKSKTISGGIWHQSNGRTEPLSRSWNRLYLNFVFERDNLAFAIKPWYRIPEDDDDDDNPDIDRYLGYGELRAAYKWNDHTFSMMFRNNLRGSGNKGAVELGWSFPLYKKLKGYVQYFNGYGQSILDYNDSANTIGVGLALSDIL